MDSHDLLQRFVQDDDQQAFEDLVRVHLPMVHQVARRHVGNHHLAEDVSQRVFQIFATKAPRLQRHPALHAWLFRATLFEAAKARRRETTRQRQLSAWKETQSTTTMPEVPSSDERLRAVETGLQALPPRERDLLLRRFYQGQSHLDISTTLGITENASQKRVARAVDKLRNYLTRRGAAVSIASITSALGRGTAHGLDPGLVERVTTKALAGAPVSSVPCGWLVLNLKTAVVAIAIGFALPWGSHWVRARLHPLSAPTSPSNAASSPTANPVPSVLLLGSVIDPAERMRRILEIDDSQQRHLEIGYLVRHLTRAEIPPALHVLTEREPEDAEHLKVFIEHWAYSQPQAALAFIDTRLPSYRARYLEALMSGWTASRPESAWQFAFDLTEDDPHREQVLDRWVQDQSFKDPAATLATLLTTPERLRDHHLKQVFAHWPHSGREKAFRTIASLPRHDWALQAAKAFIGRAFLTPDQSFIEDIDALLPAAVRDEMRAKAAGRWLASDPAKASAYLAEHLEGDEFLSIADETINKVFKEHYVELLTCFQTHLPPGKRDHYAGELFTRWLAFDGSEALANLDRLTDSQLEMMAGELGMYRAQRTPKDVYAAGQALPEKARLSYYSASVCRLAELDLPQALDLLQQLDDPAILNASFAEVATEYAAHDPEAALTWSLNTAPSEAQLQIVEEVVQEWAQHDLDAAHAWYQRQTDLQLRDHGAAGLSDSLKRLDGAAATEWALSIRDHDLRNRTLQAAVQQWAKDDVVALSQWAAEQPESIRNKVMIMLPDLTP